MKDPSSFTPMRNDKRSLLMWSDMKKTQASIAQFSANDAEVCFVHFRLNIFVFVKLYPRYEHVMGAICDVLEPLMDLPPPRLHNSTFISRLKDARRHYAMRLFFTLFLLTLSSTL